MALSSLTIEDGVRRVLASLRPFALDVVISSEQPVRRDGLPASTRRPTSDDPGVAVYWRTRGGERQCMAIDVYDTIAGNLAAVAASVDALRALERHGGARIMQRAFTGFKALPAPEVSIAEAILTLREMAGSVGPIVDKESYVLAMRHARALAHPDVQGGSHEQWDLLERVRTVLHPHFIGAL